MDREELEARTKAFAVAVIAVCDSIRAHPEGKTAAKQLLDCSSSVGANYRATSRARSRAEWIAKLGTVVEEADESAYWLEVADQAGLGDRTTVRRPRAGITEGAAQRINHKIDQKTDQ